MSPLLFGFMQIKIKDIMLQFFSAVCEIEENPLTQTQCQSQSSRRDGENIHGDAHTHLR